MALFGLGLAADPPHEDIGAIVDRYPVFRGT
jgi:hypothetical protein